MATSIDIQFFSHLNGLILDNVQGNLIELLDTCLVNGLALPAISSAEVSMNGDIHITFSDNHKVLLFQIVELSGFSPSVLNGRYRVKGAPTATQLILKATHVGSTIATTGAAKLPSLGYEVVYTGSMKRVYRAKNPEINHPYIRVDENITDGTNSYAATYAKYAMVGLLEGMTHIDDYEDTGKLQLPLDTADFKKNWKITGTGTSVIRGWARWMYASNQSSNLTDYLVPANGARNFTVIGDKDAFYIHATLRQSTIGAKRLMGCGLFDSALPTDVIPNWFLMAHVPATPITAATNYATYYNDIGGLTPLTTYSMNATFAVPKYTPLSRVSNFNRANPILPDLNTGYSNLYNSSNIPALGIPFYDDGKYLRGSLKHIHYCASDSRQSMQVTTPILGESSIYVWDTISHSNEGHGGVLYYLGELE